MKLLSRFEISRFRSIQHAELDNLGQLLALAGLNNSGKSNVLRALSAFFTNEVEPGAAIDVDRDFFRPELKHKKKKRIRVSVSFDLPPNFKFRSGLKRAEDLVGRKFKLTKEWVRENSDAPRFFINDGQSPLSLEDASAAEQFLGLVSFRYIPNRVLPTDVIREEQEALRDALVRRLGRRQADQGQVFDELRDTSVNLISGIAEHFKSIVPAVDTIRLKTPETWAEILFALGYELVTDDVETDDLVQGSGIQSLLMFETLSLIDRDYFQQFGWRQAAIWAVEEPESSLHSSLEVQLAAYLRQISGDPKGRLQVFATTHSDMILQYADRVGMLRKAGNNSTLEAADALTVLDQSAAAGISRWVHPLLYYPLEPLIFVEGKLDIDFLERAFRILRADERTRVVCIETLGEEKGGGGVDRMKKYVKAHRAAIAMRRQTAPVVALLDWDSSGKTSGFGNIAGLPFSVLAWPDDALNPELGESFRGIERAFSNRLIQAAISSGADIAKAPSGKYVVQSHDWGSVKTRLNEEVRGGLTKDDLRHCVVFLRHVLEVAKLV